MYTTINRTGLSRGRVYNGSGQNITDQPPGAGNIQVGPWDRDYSVLFQNTVMYDGEFSGIIMDGRIMSRGAQDVGPLGMDLDTDENLSDRGSVIVEGDKTAKVTGMKLHLQFCNPIFRDGGVWETGDDIASGGPAWQFKDYLSVVLDELAEGAGEADLIDDPSNTQAWAVDILDEVRHYLRVPIYIAIYRIEPRPMIEGAAEYAIENAPLSFSLASSPLEYGPLGMLTALYGTVYGATHRVDLSDEAPGFKAIFRTELEVPYAAWGGPTNGGRINQAGGDLVLNYNIGPGGDDNTWVPGAIMDTPAQRRRGAIINIDLELPHNITCAPGEVIVWHVQTGRVRLKDPLRNVPYGDDETPQGLGKDWIVAQPVDGGIGPALGPFLGLVHHRLTAYAVTR